MTGIVADIKEVAIAVTSVLLIAPLPRLASRSREFESRQAGAGRIWRADTASE